MTRQRRLTRLLSEQMNGMGDVPSDYGIPYAGRVFAPNDGQGPLGGLLPPALQAQWDALPTVGKLAVAVGGAMLIKRLLLR